MRHTTKVVTGKVVARMLGLTERRVRQLRQDGIITEEAPGLFRLEKAVQDYISFITKGDSGGNAALDLVKERALLVRTKRESEEYELRLRKRELHKSEEIRQVLSGMIVNFRSRLLSIPAKASPVLAKKSDKAEIYRYLKEQIDDALNELSDFDTLFPADVEEGETEQDNDSGGIKKRGNK